MNWGHWWDFGRPNKSRTAPRPVKVIKRDPVVDPILNEKIDKAIHALLNDKVNVGQELTPDFIRGALAARNYIKRELAR